MNSIHKQCVIVTGGENFKSRNNVSDQLLVCVYSNGEAKWYCLRSGEKRVGHCSVSDESGCYILSGRNEKNLISNICKLEIRWKIKIVYFFYSVYFPFLIISNFLWNSSSLCCSASFFFMSKMDLQRTFWFLEAKMKIYFACNLAFSITGSGL